MFDSLRHFTIQTYREFYSLDQKKHPYTKPHTLSIGVLWVRKITEIQVTEKHRSLFHAHEGANEGKFCESGHPSVTINRVSFDRMDRFSFDKRLIFVFFSAWQVVENSERTAYTLRWNSGHRDTGAISLRMFWGNLINHSTVKLPTKDSKLVRQVIGNKSYSSKLPTAKSAVDLIEACSLFNLVGDVRWREKAHDVNSDIIVNYIRDYRWNPRMALHACYWQTWVVVEWLLWTETER